VIIGKRRGPKKHSKCLARRRFRIVGLIAPAMDIDY